ncbi:5'-nucleotidase [Lentzea waywayandensis]|uniref:5'-nucleotidase n=1 Tax=Lentzea waywayandensis TaxID=84724 RepID=A0A1I6FFT1_9PSEU|nr:HAD family hydrolase [Lentzea waywayandensis]SFR28742.1 5'-nucleotidase [Lentzea waywayandensis]
MNRFVVFDLDDTLVDSTAAVDRWFAELVEERGLGDGALEFLRAEAASPAPPHESFGKIVAEFGLPETWEELRGIFVHRVPRLARPYEGAIAGLEALRRSGWRIALLTNGTEVDQLPKLDGLLDLFDAVCYADDEEERKPHLAAFTLVADRAEAVLGGAWMVGDSLKHDIAGGAAAGMRTIWVCNGAPTPADGPRPDLVVATVADAFPLLHSGDD